MDAPRPFQQGRGASRLLPHAERGNDLCYRVKVSRLISAPGNNAEAVARWL